MDAMVESVKDKGVAQAAIVRPREGGGYEMVSGHRRQMASELTGYTNMKMFEANVTNLGRYTEGHLDGEFLKLPATMEDVQSLLKRIHVDGVRYEEIFITDYDTNLAGMQNLGEYESIDELNYLASLLTDLHEWELEEFEAAAVYGEHSGSVQDLINLAQNIDCYEYYSGVNDHDDLGRYLIDELEYEEIPGRLENYFDYDSYARDYVINEGSEFVDGGFVFRNSEDFQNHYKGNDVPEEHKIFAYPAPEKSIQKALAAYQQMISKTPAAVNERPVTHESR